MTIQNKKTKRSSGGFALLIAIVVTSILLLVSFVVINVAFKEIIINEADQQSQYAFYNADSGIECAMYWDAKNGALSAFDPSTPGTITCGGQTITTGSQNVATTPSQKSQIGGGGGSGPSLFQINYAQGCSIVQVIKSGNSTTINSHGYNTCDTSALRRYERGITITY